MTKAFKENKKEIILDLRFLNTSRVNKKIRNLLFYPLERRRAKEESKRESTDFTNLFRSDLLKMFENAQSMIIQSATGSYSMSMTNLLALISSSNLNKIIIKTRKNKGKNWIDALWKSEADILKKQYAEQNYNISVEEADERAFFSISKK